MDLVPQFNDLLRQHDSQPLRPYVFRLENVDAFLQEAYSINKRISELNTYLRSIRQSYLSVTPPSRRKPLPQRPNSSSSHNPSRDNATPLTNTQRDEIDSSTKSLLRSLNASITTLISAEQIRRTTASQLSQHTRTRAGLGGLGRWAMGGAILAKSPKEIEEEEREGMIARHRDGVVWYLQKRLEETGGLQRGMMEVRIGREVERERSALSKVRGQIVPGVQEKIEEKEERRSGNGVATGGRGEYTGKYMGARAVELEEADARRAEQTLSPEQLQLFEEENHDMIKHYEDTLDKVKTAEKSLLEISELQSTLVANLSVQQEQIEQLVQDSFSTQENVGKGNKELKRATERKSTARMIFYGTCGFCATLVVWDLLI